MANKEVGVKLRIDGDSKGAQQAASATASELNKLGAAADTAGRVGASSIDDIGNAAERAEAKAIPAQRRIAEGIKSISEQLSEVKTLYAAWIGAQQATTAVAGLVATADAYANLTARIKLATGEGAAFQSAFQGVQDIALRTNTSLEATGVLFTKLAEAGKLMGIGQADALRLTETVNQAVQLSGSSAQASSAAVTQLIQSLNSGVLRGDEFNSVMEQAPRLARALADGLGVTTGELRNMADAGQLSAETVIGALSGQARSIEREFGQLPKTIGRAITDLQTQWQLWIGGLDESSGTSRSAAGAIELLAKNFDFVASSLINAGQAYLGWKAYNIAAEFFSLKTAVEASAAAKTADTAATVANTAATAANTQAQIANNAAKAGSAGATGNAAAAAGRLATALSLVKGVSFAYLLTNIIDIGKWLGESAAKAMGYGKELENNERKMRALELATKAQKDADAELAQKTRLAADAQLGLSERSGKLVADFVKLSKEGATTAQALGKIGKELDLSNIKGIADAGAALDALAVRGKVSAAEVRNAWLQALDGKDLQAFEIEARAAFDGTEQGSRRLAAAMDAQLGEALRRTGLDANALAGGIDQATNKAINDFEVLLARTDELKARGVDTGIALAASLDQAGRATKTEAAAQAVIDRWEALGKAGLVTGEKLEKGLEQARKKLDDLKPGVNSVGEAFRTLGMRSPEDLKRTAQAAEEAFNKIKGSSDFSAAGLNSTREAFKRYAEAAIAANGGIASETLKAQASVQGFTIALDASGKAMVQAANSSFSTAGGFDKVGDAAERNKVPIDLYTASLQRAYEIERRRGEGQVGVLPSPNPEFGSSENSKSVLDDPNVRNRQGKVDMTQYLYQRGGSIEEVKRASKYIGEFYARNQMSMQTGNLGTSENAARMATRAMNDAADKALEAARQEIKTGQPVDIGTSVNDIVAQKMALIDHSKDFSGWAGSQRQTAAMKQAGNEANSQPIKTIRIDLGTGAHDRVSLFAEDEDAANRFLTLMERKAKVSSKR